jgi:hypothetical protein
MPLYKTGLDMFSKYQKKYNPTVVSTRFTDVQEVAMARAQAGLHAVATIRGLITDVLDTQGIAGGSRATYLAFALKLWKHVSRQGGANKEKIKDGLVAYFKTAYGLDESVLSAIGDAIIVAVTPSP